MAKVSISISVPFATLMPPSAAEPLRLFLAVGKASSNAESGRKVVAMVTPNCAAEPGQAVYFDGGSMTVSGLEHLNENFTFERYLTADEGVTIHGE